MTRAAALMASKPSLGRRTGPRRLPSPVPGDEPPVHSLTAHECAQRSAIPIVTVSPSLSRRSCRHLRRRHRPRSGARLRSAPRSRPARSSSSSAITPVPSRARHPQLAAAAPGMRLRRPHTRVLREPRERTGKGKRAAGREPGCGLLFRPGDRPIPSPARMSRTSTSLRPGRSHSPHRSAMAAASRRTPRHTTRCRTRPRPPRGRDRGTARRCGRFPPCPWRRRRRPAPCRSI